MLVVQTLGAPPPPRRRRRIRAAEPADLPATLPLVRVTAARAYAPFAAEEGAVRWLEQTSGDEEAIDAVVAEGLALLNRALHAQAVAAAEARAHELSIERAAAVRVGYGSGEEIADGLFSAAMEFDVRSAGSRRRRRQEDLQPQERVAAFLGAREYPDACETLLLRARADLDADRRREAALQLRVGLEALLTELRGATSDPGHEEDMATLSERRSEAGEAANEALAGELTAERREQVRELLELCERVLRRRRVLRG